MSTDDERQRLAATFNRAAALYQRARPEYPTGLYERLLTTTKLSPPARLLEVGCATGKATLPLAQRGFRITCLEPGADLAVAARANLAGFSVEVVEERFEDWVPPSELFALVFAATAWHWVDPTVRYRKTADWETAYDAEGYIDLLNTFSGHIAMQDWQRNRLYGEIRRRLAERPGGRVRRHWGGVLQIAQRRTA